MSTVLTYLVAFMILVVEELTCYWDVVINHVFSSVVSHIENLSIEAQPVQKPVYFLADVRFSSCRD